MTAQAHSLAGTISARPRQLSAFWIDLALLAPGCGFLFLAMVVPIAQLVLGSIGLFSLGSTSAVTAGNFRVIAEDVLLRSGFFFSLRIALAISRSCVFIFDNVAGLPDGSTRERAAGIEPSV